MVVCQQQEEYLKHLPFDLLINKVHDDILDVSDTGILL